MDPEVFRAASFGNSRFFDENSNGTLLQVTSEKNTVLHVALQFKNFEAAERIVTLSSRLVYETNSKGNTPLHVAARVGKSSIVKLLIDQAKILDVETGGRQLLTMVNQDGDTALHIALRYDNDGQIEIVKELIKEAPELAKHVNNAGESALFLAVDRELYDLVSHILSNAPDCSYDGSHGMNVLHALVLHTSCCKCFSCSPSSLLHKYFCTFLFDLYCGLCEALNIIYIYIYIYVKNIRVRIIGIVTHISLIIF